MSQQISEEETAIPLYPKKKLPRVRKLSKEGKEAERLLKQYSLISSGFGFLSGALLHQTSSAALLIKLLSDMSKIYGVSFSDNQSKILIAAILGGSHTHWINHYLTRTMRRYTPFGRSMGMRLLRPAVTGSVIYYTGRLFLIHFETGIWRRRK